MSDSRDSNTHPESNSGDRASSSSTNREPWETPRVLVSEPFGSAQVGMDGDPMEGILYGPS